MKLKVTLTALCLASIVGCSSNESRTPVNKTVVVKKEDLSKTLEPQGQTNGYNAKLLLNTFGNYAQTIIQNPVYFNPSLLSLDKLSFYWFDVNNIALTNADCEWNTAIQIVEEYAVPNIRGKNPIIPH